MELLVRGKAENVEALKRFQASMAFCCSTLSR